MESATIQFITNNIFFGNEIRDEKIQNWKENLVSIVQQIKNGESELKPIIQFLVTILQPSRIYRINHPCIEIDSKKYIDLLVVLPTSNQKSFIELEPILEIPYVNNELVCCSLHNEGNLKEHLALGHIFYSLHCTEENIVYDNSKAQYPVISTQVLAEIKQKIREEFLQDIQKAQDFGEAAAEFPANKSSSIVPFLLHQAVELTYRSILKHLNGYDKKTHSLQALRKYIRRCAPQLCTVFAGDTETGRHINRLLDDAYIDARYLSDFTIPNELLSDIFEKVIRLQEASVCLVTKQTQ